MHLPKRKADRLGSVLVSQAGVLMKEQHQAITLNDRNHRGSSSNRGGASCAKIVRKGATGSDKITGGAGSDTILAGPGNDTVNSKDGKVDHVDCGPGTDTVVADKTDVLKNCENHSS